jgi:two-component system CheB/CheR fusion protein
MGELQQSNDDLHNVLAGIGNAVVIVGMDLRIRRYTHAAERLFNLVSSDIGRNVNLLGSFLRGERVDELISRVIAELTPIDREVEGSDGRWYSMRITPFRTLEHSIKGAVVSVTDIDVRKRMSELGRSVSEYANSFLSVIHNPLMIVDRKMRVVWANESFYEAFQLIPEECLGNPFNLISDKVWNVPGLLTLLESAVATGSAFRDFKVTKSFATLGEKSFRVSGNRIPSMGGEVVLILLSFEDHPASGK